MTRLTWGASGERFYETGLDRGVLYPEGDTPGVPWNGLSSVTKKASGGESQGYYLDGIKYRNISAFEEFEATMEAFTRPAEFAPCEGVVPVATGLFVTHQPKQTFGLSYRSLIGNDIEDTDLGYKIHLVYGAIATAGDRSNSTINSDLEINTLTWDIATLAPQLANRKPTAHLIVDSRTTDPTLLIELEDILYGSLTLIPSLPTPTEMVTLFS